MTKELKNKIRILGAMILVVGLCVLPSLLVAIIYKEFASIKSFAVLAAICIMLGTVAIKFLPSSSLKLKKRDGFFLVSIAWLFISAIGAIPFVTSGAIPNYIDAFFETCSGLSTTGSSILTDIEALPKSMLFWRSFTHWMGGMGIIVFTTALLPSMGIEGQTVASAETPGPTLDKLTARYSDTARNLYMLYFGFTVVETVLLLFGGMNLYDALVHTFGTVGTGGFSPYNDGIAHFTSPYIHWVIIIFMALCGTNFNLFFRVKSKGPKALFKDAEFRLYIGIMGICSVLAFIDLMAKGVYQNAGEGFTASLFQVSSVMTTTGFATANYDVWPSFAKMMLTIVFFTGACSSSTGGGPKIIRILIAIKLVKREISMKLHPNRVHPVRINGSPVSAEVSTGVCNFLFFYVFVLFAGMILIAFNGFDFITTFSSTLTCIGNIGPGFGLVGPTCNFSIFTPFSKIVLSLLMIAGRLELFTFFMLFSPHYWKSNRY